MQNSVINELLRKEIQKEFRGKRTLKSKRAPRYRENLEREMKRIADGYAKLSGESFRKYYPVIQDAIKEELKAEKRNGIIKKSFWLIVADTFAAMERDLDKRANKYNLETKLMRLAEQTKKLSVEDWRLMVKQTLKIDLMSDYYNGEFYASVIDDWIKLNTDLIKTIPHETLGEMRQIVQEGFLSGERSKDMAEQIEHVYGVSRSKAKFLARDQMAKLNGQFTFMQQADAGVTEYIWSTSKDQRVRHSHAKLDGKRFKWSEPPIVDEKTGRRCHPMQDYQCRCCAIPVFDIETIELPISQKEGK